MRASLLLLVLSSLALQAAPATSVNPDGTELSPSAPVGPVAEVGTLGDPDAYVEIIAGTTVNNWPWSTSLGNSMRFQMLYLKTEIGRNGHITSFAFQNPNTVQRRFNNITIKMCNTPITAVQAADMNANYGGRTPQVVYTTPTRRIGSGIIGGWDSLPVSFDYDSAYNLLVEVIWNTAETISGNPQCRYGTRSPARRTWCWNWQGNVGVQADAYLYNVRLGFVEGDVGVTHIVAPSGLVDSNQAIIPACSVRNHGTSAVGGYPVKMRVGSFCAITATAGSHPAGTTIYVTFPAFSAWNRGSHTVTCSTAMAGDLNPANDKATGSVDVQVRDVSPIVLLAPTGSIDSGGTITPACTLGNFGTTTETYDVRMRIGTQYDQTLSIPDHAPGVPVHVTFPDWLARERGWVAVSCSTTLTGDNGPTNDVRLDSVFVGVADIGPTAIIAPTGRLDSGSIITPQATVRNFGNAQTTCDITFSIDLGYTSTITRTIGPESESTFAFADWTADGRGNHITQCSTYYVRDVDPANDVLLDSVVLDVHDIGIAEITNPQTVIGPGLMNPTVRLANYGTVREPVSITFGINGLIPYGDTIELPGGVAPESDTTIEFASWLAEPGAYTASCSAYLETDQLPDNNVLTQGFEVGEVDVGVVAIIAPTGTPDTAADIAPAARVKNFAEGTVTFETWFWIDSTSGNAYAERITVTDLAPGAEATATFPAWSHPHPVGSYTTRCSTALGGDGNAANNQLTGRFSIRAGGGGGGETGWVRKLDLPLGAKSKKVKDGGALAYLAQASSSKPQARSPESDQLEACGLKLDAGFVYAFKGNGRYEFYRYNTLDNTWATLESIPAIGRAGKKKPVKKGSALTASGGIVYGAKGNNSLEWWAYDPALHTWTQKADVPTGAKNLKEGTGAVTVEVNDTAYIYLLRGANSTDFHRYNPLTDAWQSKAPAPVGASGKNYKNGSAIATDGTTIWALKGSYNELAAYDLATNTWATRTGLPLIGRLGKKKKVKDGAGMAYYNGYVLAQKGGNTVEFWNYQADSDKWTQIEDVPMGSGRNVKGGGTLCYGDLPYPALYEFKGNNTCDFFKYGLGAMTNDQAPMTNDGIQRGSSFRTPHSTLRISPNPSFRNPHSTIRIDYSLPNAGKISLKLYDVTGKLVTVLVDGYRTAGSSAFSVQRSAFSSGIYILKLTTETTTATAKLVIE